MIYRIQFNDGKHQRGAYYWIPYKSIWNGEYMALFKKEKEAGNISNTTEFKNYLVITTKKALPQDDRIKEVTVSKAKTESTFSEIREVIENG